MMRPFMNQMAVDPKQRNTVLAPQHFMRRPKLVQHGLRDRASYAALILTNGRFPMARGAMPNTHERHFEPKHIGPVEPC